MSVPYHTLDLDEKLSYKQDKADGNLIIEGDNLPALKSLLPQYTGKIDCIYIDPPYNTGTEDWIYNDNINSPLISDWIGKIVAKDDLTRHDKWLAMMTPRLKILRELLSEGGVIYISIGEDELGNLKLLMEEIFGQDNFISVISRVAKTASNKGTYFAPSVDYIVTFARDINYVKPFRDEVNKDLYPKEDELGKYRDDVALFQSGLIGDRPNCRYYIDCPDGSKVIPPIGKFWRWEKATSEKNKELLVFKETKTSPLLDENGKQAKYNIYTKSYLSQREEDGTLPRNYLDKFINRKGADFLKSIDISFDYAKPTELIAYLVKILNQEKDIIILDAFAGSGTTAQAVLELNEGDEGNRKFILIQMPENSEKEPKKNIARDITRERVVKVIEKKLENKDVGFEYRRVGQPIDAETILSGQLPTYKQLAKYVYYLATGQSPKDKDIDEKKYLAGKVDHTEVYLLYTPDMEELKKMAITFEWAKEISKSNGNKKIVYAPACFMDDEYLEQFNIKFVSIPYNLFEREK